MDSKKGISWAKREVIGSGFYPYALNVDYLCNWSWALLSTVYLCLHHPFTWHQSQYWNAAEVYHQHWPLRSTRESTVWLATPFKLQSKDTNTLHHTFPSCFPICEEPTSQHHPNPLSLLQNSLQELSACVKLWLQPFLHWCLSGKVGLIGWDTLIIRARL